MVISVFCLVGGGGGGFALNILWMKVFLSPLREVGSSHLLALFSGHKVPDPWIFLFLCICRFTHVRMLQLMDRSFPG